MSSQRLYLNSLLCIVYIFQIIKSDMADAHSAGTKSELMKFGTLSFLKYLDDTIANPTDSVVIHEYMATNRGEGHHRRQVDK